MGEIIVGDGTLGSSSKSKNYVSFQYSYFVVFPSLELLLND